MVAYCTKASFKQAIASRLTIRTIKSLLLDSFTAAGLVATQSMLFNGEAEIVNSACKPFLVAKLDKVIISP